MVPDDSDRIPRAPPYSGVSMTRCSLPVREYHPLRRDFPDASGSCIRYFLEILQPRKVRKLHGLGSSRFDRHYPGNRSFFLFLRVLRCFSSPRSPPLLVQGIPRMRGGLSHSEITGSRDICASPVLFAAYHVLHRLREPRHPPCALLFLTKYHTPHNRG